MKYVLVVFFCSLSLVVGAEESWDFDALLKEMNMAYQQPEGWRPAKQVYSQVASNRVLVTPDGKAELHLLLRPVSLMSIDYDDPHSSAPNPNEVFPLLFDSLVQQLSNNQGSNKQELLPRQAQEKFNANWAAASVFDLKQRTSEVYSEGLLIAMHRHNAGDAYLLVLSNSLGSIKNLIQSAETSLVFNE